MNIETMIHIISLILAPAVMISGCALIFNGHASFPRYTHPLAAKVPTVICGMKNKDNSTEICYNFPGNSSVSRESCSTFSGDNTKVGWRNSR
jgi:hypothetical protein